jgi:hypothetical protein
VSVAELVSLRGAPVAVGRGHSRSPLHALNTTRDIYAQLAAEISSRARSSSGAVRLSVGTSPPRQQPCRTAPHRTAPHRAGQVRLDEPGPLASRRPPAPGPPPRRGDHRTHRWARHPRRPARRPDQRPHHDRAPQTSWLRRTSSSRRRRPPRAPRAPGHRALEERDQVHPPRQELRADRATTTTTRYSAQQGPREPGAAASEPRLPPTAYRFAGCHAQGKADGNAIKRFGASDDHNQTVRTGLAPNADAPSSSPAPPSHPGLQLLRLTRPSRRPRVALVVRRPRPVVLT